VLDNHLPAVHLLKVAQILLADMQKQYLMYIAWLIPVYLY